MHRVYSDADVKQFEAGLVGSLLLKWSMIPEVAQRCQSSDFLDEELREIYIHIGLFWERYPNEDITLLAKRMMEAGVCKDGLLARLAELMNRSPTPHNAKYYAEEVRKASLRRQWRKLGQDLIYAAEDVTTHEDMFRMFEKRATLLETRRTDGEFGSDPLAHATTLRQASCDYLDTLAEDRPTLIPSGISKVDDSIGGVGYGEMCVLAARPGHGKSAFGLQWLDTAARDGVKCLLISEEMSRLELGKRCVASVCGQSSPDALDDVPDFRQRVERHFDDREEIYVMENVQTIDKAEQRIDRYCGEHGVQLVAVDYLQLMKGKGENRYHQVSDVSMRLKSAAQRNKCALLVMVQCSREIETRASHSKDKEKRHYTPHNSDLKDSGQIEQDADVILFLQWPLKFDPYYPHKDEYRIYATKCRNRGVKHDFMTTKFFPERQRVAWFESEDFPKGAMEWQP